MLELYFFYLKAKNFEYKIGRLIINFKTT
jgi:hypothetical protein